MLEDKYKKNQIPDKEIFFSFSRSGSSHGFYCEGLKCQKQSLCSLVSCMTSYPTVLMTSPQRAGSFLQWSTAPRGPPAPPRSLWAPPSYNVLLRHLADKSGACLITFALSPAEGEGDSVSTPRVSECRHVLVTS